MSIEAVLSVAVSLLLVSAGLSALACRRAVVASLTPFVWPSIELRVLGLDARRTCAVGLRLPNDGPGSAFDVEYELVGGRANPQSRASNFASPVPAISPGGFAPVQPVEELEDDPGEYRIPLGRRVEDGPLKVAVRYQDALGRRWETQGRLGARVTRPRRLRRWPWELWRSKGTKLDGEAREPPAPRETGKGSLVTAAAIRD